MELLLNESNEDLFTINTEYDNWPKYLIFLSNNNKRKCHSSCCYKSNTQSKLTKKLKKCGMNIQYDHRKPIYQGTFNDNSFPEINTIYIRLTQNKYYSDTIYPQKKVELEREILLLLTGLLGGNKITCNSNVSKNYSNSLNVSLNTNALDESVQYNNSSIINNNIKRDEIYENTGASILIQAQDKGLKEGWIFMLNKLEEIFKIIERTSASSFDYFLQNSDLYTFVFKRYALKLTNYVYRIQEDRTLEKSIQARTILNSYGFSIEIDNKMSILKVHEYIIEFYDLQDLRDYFDIKKMKDKYKLERERDIFARLRREYEFNNIIMKKYWPDWGGDEKPIYKEVIKYTKSINIYDNLKNWIDEGGDLCGPCHWFKSKIDLDIWLNKTLKTNINIA